MDRGQLNLIRPPPLLPLLLHRNPLPSPCKRDQRKRKPRSQSVTPTKNPKAKAAAIAPAPPRDQRPLRFCLDFADQYSIYSKSPPPSSLPLPGFALVKPKSDGLTLRSSGDGVDAGATAALRRLLGL